MEIGFIIWFAFLITGAIYIGISYKLLKIRIYFLKFKIVDHPILITMVEDIFQRICKEQGITIFYKTYDELNPPETPEEQRVLGRYIYARNQEQEDKIKNSLKEVEALEAEWHMSYEQLCKRVGSKTTLKKEDFILPRILLCKDEIEMYGLDYYYGTHFHELGHHFASKEMGEHNEDDANRYGSKIVRENLPIFFQLFPLISLGYRFKEMPEFSFKDRLKAYHQYYIYLRVKNKK
jgi:hypothetical protein